MYLKKKTVSKVLSLIIFCLVSVQKELFLEEKKKLELGKDYNQTSHIIAKKDKVDIVIPTFNKYFVGLVQKRS